MSVITHQRSLVAEILKSPTYSILILDEYSLALVNTLFRLIDLRRLNITSILLITDQRDPIDAHAIYFINSTHSKIVAEDINKNLYRTVSLNFTDSISRAKLEDLAKNVSKSGKANTITTVFDRFLTYCGTDSNSFLISDGNQLFTKESPNTDKKNLVNSLYSFFQNSDTEPLMFTYHPLLNKIKNNNLTFKKKAILLFFNRKEDIFAPMMFNWFYAGLVDDLLEMKTNMINYSKGKEIETENISYNIMWDDDFFIKNKYEKIELVSERIEKEHKEYRMQIVDKNRNIPSLTKRGEIIKGHMGIVLAVIDKMSDLAYDEFFHASENMKKDDIMTLAEKGTKEMRQRMLALMIREGLNEVDVADWVKNSNIDQGLVSKIVQSQYESDNFQSSEHNESDESEMSPLSRIRSNSYSNLTQNIFNRVKQSINRFTGGKTLKCKLSLQLDEILKELKSNGLNLLNKRNKKEICYSENISKIVVMVEGGGCQRELFEIRGLIEEHDIDIVYGSEYMINGTEMINEIERE